MDNRGIGVFDSGLGGLTAASVLEQLLPEEDIWYFGDSARAPYGPRSREELCSISEQNVQFLRSFDVKAILMACGTTSSNAMDYLLSHFTIPIFGVIDPAAKAAAAGTRGGRIGVIATAATIRTDAFARAIHRECPDHTVLSLACPALVPMIESGHYKDDDPVVLDTLREQLAPLLDAHIDTLLLGCTHFPLLHHSIERLMGRSVLQISSGAEAAKALVQSLQARDMLHRSGHKGQRHYYISGDPARFSTAAALFLGHPVELLHHNNNLINNNLNNNGDA